MCNQNGVFFLFLTPISSPYGYKKTLHFLAHRAGTKYTVSVFGMFDGGESLPLAGEEKTTLSEDPEPYIDLSAGEVILLEKAQRVSYRSDQTLCENQPKRLN